jgi:hypothetical protein
MSKKNNQRRRKKQEKITYQSVFEKMFKVLSFDTILKHAHRKDPIVADSGQYTESFGVLINQKSVSLGVAF